MEKVIYKIFEIQGRKYMELQDVILLLDKICYSNEKIDIEYIIMQLEKET